MHYFVCVSAAGDASTALEQNKWAGLMIVRGPLSVDEYNDPKRVTSSTGCVLLLSDFLVCASTF